MNALPPVPSSLAHYVSTAPFDVKSVQRLSPAQERVYLASQWRLMWWKFKRHRLAVLAGLILLVLYGTIPFSEFLAPYNGQTRNTEFIRSPPQRMHFFHEGRFAPFVYGEHFTLNLKDLNRDYALDRTEVQHIRFFCHGDRYRFWGLIAADRHLMCPARDGTLFLLGSDRLGRDILSRMIYGARISLTVGLIGISISFLLGITIGGLAGYYGGWFDLISQRAIEIVHSIPHIPLWLALGAVMPVTWSPMLVYFGITVILGLMDWTGLARAVRAKLLSLREEDYVLAARLMGAGTPRVLFRHLLPGFISHLIASATITIPSMILGETALSFLGLGLRAPVISWGVMLNEAQNMNVVVLYPWLMLPVVPVILVILAFNFLGDGLRDAADPYH
ncbi:ABC transporter permease [Lichenihabitans sp. Uapishka_5]|uniref:ABC transporter permease n=1 Tax=Lichenihabitans sp. Uapishka_5 TaxID=3037302 RepID=UPI0029E801DD|nr:ABC transporter permease [Lichenihabitans sp. Uapishka_5]MDX7950620.1 ABC transporter permease [Lichenihabitans sp. Uapishka_5]